MHQVHQIHVHKIKKIESTYSYMFAQINEFEKLSKGDGSSHQDIKSIFDNLADRLKTLYHRIFPQSQDSSLISYNPPGCEKSPNVKRLKAFHERKQLNIINMRQKLNERNNLKMWNTFLFVTKFTDGLIDIEWLDFEDSIFRKEMSTQ